MSASFPQGYRIASDERALTILSLNSGSSSLKFGVYRVTDIAIDILLSGEVESIGKETGSFSAEGPVTGKNGRQNKKISETLPIAHLGDAVLRIHQLFAEYRLPQPIAVGHRIVHGGPSLTQHCLIDQEVLHSLEAAAAFAPLHTPPALAVIRAAQDYFPDAAHAACFDTAFHAGLPDVARTLPIARSFLAEGLHRYGFHGLSCESILHQLASIDDQTPQRLVIAHLGSGASITAVKDGQSIDTSMGLTPSGGVIMGSRSGDLDPGVLIYLMRQKQFDADMLEQLVDHQSGLAGISGVSGDMRRLHEEAGHNGDARLAIDMFCYSVRKGIAAMAAALEGVDLIVFAGGVGEHDATARASICQGLAWLGVTLDPERNRSATNPISQAGARCRVLVLPSQEDEQIAFHTRRLFLGKNGRN